MDLHSDVAAAWAQAILSALAILASGILAVAVPVYIRLLERRDRQIRGAKSLFLVLGTVEAWAAHVMPDEKRKELGHAKVAAAADEMRAMSDLVRSMQPDDIPPDGLPTLFLARSLAATCAVTLESTVKEEAEGYEVHVNMGDVAADATAAIGRLRDLKIGRRSVEQRLAPHVTFDHVTPPAG